MALANIRAGCILTATSRRRAGDDSMIDEIDTLLKETRTFAPPAKFRAVAHVSTPAIYKRAARKRLAFWAECAKQLEWIKPWRRVLDWKPPHAKWFVGGKLNASV